MVFKHIVVCVSGYSGSGKDEFVRQFVDSGSPKVGLADPAKRHIADLYGFSEHQLFGPSSARNGGDVRYPKQSVRDLEMAPSSHSAEDPPQDLVGELKPGVRYWEYSGRGGLHSQHGDTLPYVPTKLGGSRVFVAEGNPSFWLSPREALQRYCEIMNTMYENTWIKKSLETHRKLGESQMVDNTRCLSWSYDRMKGVQLEMRPIQPGVKVLITCSADFRHRHEIVATRQATTTDFIPVIVRVKRPSIPEPPYEHRSETEMKTIPDSDFDFVVENDGSLEELWEKANLVVREASSPGFSPRRSP